MKPSSNKKSDFEILQYLNKLPSLEFSDKGIAHLLAKFEIEQGHLESLIDSCKRMKQRGY